MLDDRQSVARLLNSRGLAAYDVGDYDRATALLEESLSLARSLRAWHGVALAMNNLALVAQERRDFAQAMSLQAEALDLWEDIGNLDGIADCLQNFAMFTAGLNELPRSTASSGPRTPYGHGFEPMADPATLSTCSASSLPRGGG